VRTHSPSPSLSGSREFFDPYLSRQSGEELERSVDRAFQKILHTR